MTDMKRRVLLKGALAGGAIAAAASAGLLSPRTVLAAWPESAFAAKSVPDALSALLGTPTPGDSHAIEVKVPEVAENGAVVPITVSTTLTGVESISILLDGNDSPLASRWTLGPGAQPFIATRVKMAKSANVVAVVVAGGKVFQAKKAVSVTVGGCG